MMNIIFVFHDSDMVQVVENFFLQMIKKYLCYVDDIMVADVLVTMEN